MADRSLVSKDLRVEAFNNAELAMLLAWLARPNSGHRWVLGRPEGKLEAVWPNDGKRLPANDAEAFCREQKAIGVEFPGDTVKDFFRRFVDADDTTALMQVAGIVAPVLPNLHQQVRGLNGYNLKPAAKTQTLINLLGRFLPKDRAIAILSEIDGKKIGLYVVFNNRREIERVVGVSRWPAHVVQGGPLKDLSVLGRPVDVGIRITADAFRGLFEDKLNRAGYAKLFKKGDIVLDPLPLAPKLALKAAMII